MARKKAEEKLNLDTILFKCWDTIVKICVALQCDISDVVTLCNKEA